MTTSRRDRGGFALLELLVVVTVLAATAALAIAALDSGGDQTRRDLTQSRLRALELALIGPAWEGGSARAAGYAADIGVLPASLSNLLTAPADGALLYGLKTPLFNASPNTGTGLNDGAGVPVSTQTLPKGWRGPYLELAPGASTYRDGWGNQSAVTTDDAANYGWGYVAFSSTTGGSATTATTPLSVTSLGKDGMTEAAATAAGSTIGTYDVDASLEVKESDWTVETAGWNVRLGGGAGAWYSVSLLVYENGNWLRLSTAPVGGPAPAAGTCGDLSADLGMVWLDGSCDAQVVKFPINGGYATGTVSSKVPYGRHVLVVVQHAAGGTTQLPLLNSAVTVDLVRGAQPPTTTLEVRS